MYAGKSFSLTSRWTLLNGCPQELYDALLKLVEEVECNEEKTLFYRVNLDFGSPLDDKGQPVKTPPVIPLEQQGSVTFFESYADEQAFVDHVNGDIFQNFLKANIKHFLLDPTNPNLPRLDNGYFQQVAGFARQEIITT